MKIAIMGTGGVGGFFGGMLARAGEDVTFIARGSHLEAIRQNGLRVASDLSGEFIVRSNATDDSSTVGFVDLVLFTVKMYHNEQAIETVRPMVGADTVVLTLQNGIDNGEKLAAGLGRRNVMVGMAAVQSRIREPGTVEQLGQLGRVVFGEMEQGITERGERLLEVFRGAGWNVELSDNAMAALWQKFIYLTATAGINAITQVPFKDMRTIPETRELIRSAYQEIIDVAKAREAPIRDDMLDAVMQQLDDFPAEGMTSLANAFRNGNRVELEGITGTVVRLASETNVPVPINKAIYALLRPAAIRIEQSSRQ